MRRIRLSATASLAAALGVMTSPAAATAAGSVITMSGAPPGFADLEAPRELLVDVYFGDRRIGEAWIIARPGFVRLRDPARVLALIPDLKSSPILVAHLSQELEDHAGRACHKAAAAPCAALETDLAGVILDEDQFRLDLFVAPAFLQVAGAGDPYLPVPNLPLSLTSQLGAAIAGSIGGSEEDGETTYNVQNRTIVGFRNARIRSDSALASDIGFVVDDLVAEFDTKRHRFSGGLFWAPGVDFTGRRRIAGFGVSTQFDTRADGDALEATPLILFLPGPARVEVLIDGRLAASGSYEAGNRLIDTAALPSGSYPLVLRIRDASGRMREERRFFVKNAAIAPVGQPVYFAYAGLLANTRRGRPVSLSKSLFYQIGAARRLSDALALDAGIIGTEDRPIAQVGGWLMTDLARIRAAALASADGDKGLLFQLGSSGAGPLSFNIDLRRVWSRSGEPLIPLPSTVDNFGSVPPVGGQIAAGSYAQGTGSVSLSLGGAFVSLTGSYRRDRGAEADYSLGPSLSWPIVNRGGLQLVLNADAQRSRTTTAAFAGFRLLYTAGGYSSLATGGYASLKTRGGRGRSARQVGSISAQWFHQDEERTQIGAEAALQRDVETTTARAELHAVTGLGSGRVEVLHSLEGRGGTQYGLTVQTGVAAEAGGLAVGGHDLNQSALLISANGSAPGAAFDILIDGVPRGRLGAGTRMPVFLEAYRSYRVRLRPVGATAVSYDPDIRTVTLYPGNVERLDWAVAPMVTLFGQAIGADGRPLADAAVASSRGVGRTDGNGYFQIDAAAADVLEFRAGDQSPCKVPLAGIGVADDYARLGKVICK